VKSIQWLPIPRFPGYEVSDAGEIRNKRGRILKQRLNNGCMKADIGRATVLVHGLVLRTFTGQPTHYDKDHYMPKHIGDRLDNRLENLAWAMK
jgi:hypothetical protein